MYNSILVPLDGSKLAENIIAEVERLAVLLNARLNLVFVSSAHVFPGVDPTDAQVRVVNEAKEYLDNIKNQLKQAALTYHSGKNIDKRSRPSERKAALEEISKAAQTRAKGMAQAGIIKKAKALYKCLDELDNKNGMGYALKHPDL